MYIESLELKNFRNYNELQISFDPNTNILFGDNAQGKTNILEALFLTATTKSHRASKDREMIQFDQEESHIKVYLNKDGIQHKIDMHLKKNKSKGVAIDGIPIRKSSELFGICNIVFFSPEDLSIIKNGPGERRRFMDMELCQIDKIYLQYLQKYHKILNQRNNLLKQIKFNPMDLDTLDIWDEQLVTYGTYIIKRRIQFIDQLNEMIAKIHFHLTGGREQLKITYENSLKDYDYMEYLKKRRTTDIQYTNTSIGPHRDDICFFINEMDIRKYGSQGQQRTAALSLKLSEIEIVKKVIHDTPILLLDDVLSELDSNRQNYLLDHIHDIQMVLTCTGVNDFVNSRLKTNCIYRVQNGSTKKVENTMDIQ